MADAHSEEEFMTQSKSFEDRFVTRREYYRDHRDIMDKFAKQDVKFERMEGRTQRMLEDLDELPDALDKLGGTLDKINGRLTNVEGIGADLGGRVEAMESSIKGRSEHNTKIWVAIITGGFGLLGTALLFSQIFFQ